MKSVTTLGEVPATPDAGPVTRQIIRRVGLGHCKKGPSVCRECREMGEGRPSLLELIPPRQDGIQRRLIQVDWEGEALWREYEIVKVFATEAEAREYAGRNGIADVSL